VRFGANYVPRRHWWHAWSNWEGDEVRSDLRALADLGLDHVRIHLLWPLFQPVENYVSPHALDHLAELLDLADEAGLDVWVTVLDGWLSGFAYVPAWMEKTSISPKRNMFTDRSAIEAEKLLFRSLASRIGDHPRFAGFDLGNELGVMAFFGHPASHEEADAWGREMIAHVNAVAPGKLHVLGTDHNHWLADHHFTREFVASASQVTVHHSWASFTGALDKGRVEAVHLLGFMTAYARAYHADPAKLVWQQEFGMSEAWLRKEEVVPFVEESFRASLSYPHHFGFTFWCSHDLPADWAGFHPCEYDLGLIGQDGRAKEMGLAVARVIEEYREGRIEEIPWSGVVEVPRRPYTSKGNYPPNWEVADAWFEAFRRCERPEIHLVD
jgi:endo-1,4-beta-mannosidase